MVSLLSVPAQSPLSRAVVRQATHLVAQAAEQRSWAQQVALELTAESDAAELVERQKNAIGVFEVFFLARFEGERLVCASVSLADSQECAETLVELADLEAVGTPDSLDLAMAVVAQFQALSPKQQLPYERKAQANRRSLAKRAVRVSMALPPSYPSAHPLWLQTMPDSGEAVSPGAAPSTAPPKRAKKAQAQVSEPRSLRLCWVLAMMR